MIEGTDIAFVLYLGLSITDRCLTSLFVLHCRHILASLHFNENVKRQKLTSEDGQEYYKVTYPKFKLGEEVVREVEVPPTYGELQHTLYL